MKAAAKEGTLQPHSALTRKILGSKPPPIPGEREINPKTRSNPISRVTWGWLSRLMYTGFNRVLELQDIYKINDKESIEPLMAVYRQKVLQYKSRGRTNAHWRALFATIQWRFYWAFLVTLFAFGSELCLSVINRPMISLIGDIYLGKSHASGHAAAYAVGNTLITVVYMLSILWSGYYFHYIGQLLRTLVIAAVYEKTILLSPYGHSQFPTASITSLVTTDTTRIYAASRWTAQMIAAIPGGGACLGILIHNLGVSALAGFAIIVVGCLGTILSSKFISSFRGKSLPFADKRISCVTETIENMRILKFYGWEPSYAALTSKFRREEEGFLVKLGRVESIDSSLIATIPYFAGLLAFAIRSILESNMDPARIFPSLTLFLSFAPLASYFSNGLNSHAEAYNSYKRLRDFFNADELHTETSHGDSSYAVELNGAVFQWLSAKEPPKSRSLLKRVVKFFKFGVKEPSIPEQEESAETEQPKLEATLQIAPGELVMITGKTGSGKSSLLHAIAGMMPKKLGLVSVNGGVTSVMNHWSMSTTVRDNILFGAEMDEKRYAETLRVCSLGSDLAQFSSGDLTAVGERGVTLSGGQKARLALARGVYNAKEIVLLDDVLAAVDAKVGREIFEQCILGHLNNRTRIITTNNHRLLKHADKIVVVESSKAHTGTFDELKDRFKFENIVDQETETEAQPEEQEEIQDKKIQENEGQELMTEEDTVKGRVQGKVLLQYLKFGGAAWMVPCVLLLLCLTATSKVMQSIFLNWWTAERWPHSKGWYIGIYAAIIAVMCLATIILEYFLCFFCLRASSGLHNAALQNIYRAPISYFDTTPIGRLITRLTDDVANLDMMIFMLLRMGLPGLTALLATMIVIFVYVPWTLLCIIPIVVFTVLSVNYYRLSSREITRATGVFRSNTFGHVSETMGGLDVVVGYGQASRFTKKLYECLDDFNSATFINTATQFWIAWRVMISTLPMTFVVTMLCAFHVFSLDESSVAMLLSMLPDLFVTIATTMVVLVEVEKELNSVERVYELAYDIPQEPLDGIEPPAEWPLGQITFQGACLKYRPELPLVLRGFDVSIAAGEKIGICGRTGAGKSSLMAALFRLTELDSGSIQIDGLDTRQIKLELLRSKLSIIPQDPVLFAGTIRSNLDPFGQYNDVELQDSLKRAGLSFTLDAGVDAKGTNYSLGQRQLLTLARALARRSKIICLDEATANVDHQTDAVVQRTIATEFAASTILCIAHRLDTIVNYDRIIVMDSGKIAQIGTPRELFAQQGIFHMLCSEAGISLE